MVNLHLIKYIKSTEEINRTARCYVVPRHMLFVLHLKYYEH
jgi:hypothetical protein